MLCGQFTQPQNLQIALPLHPETIETERDKSLKHSQPMFAVAGVNHFGFEMKRNKWKKSHEIRNHSTGGTE